MNLCRNTGLGCEYQMTREFSKKYSDPEIKDGKRFKTILSVQGSKEITWGSPHKRDIIVHAAEGRGVTHG